MIDIANYKRSIAWLKRGIADQSAEPSNRIFSDGLTQSAGVTYNLTEIVLRQALAGFSEEAVIPFLSSRELMRYADDEGLHLASPEAWLRYGIALEQANATQGDSFSVSLLPLLPEYAEQLEGFAERLEGRRVPVV